MRGIGPAFGHFLVGDGLKACQLDGEFQTQIKRQAGGKGINKFLLMQSQFAQFPRRQKHWVAEIIGLDAVIGRRRRFGRAGCDAFLLLRNTGQEALDFRIWNRLGRIRDLVFGTHGRSAYWMAISVM